MSLQQIDAVLPLRYDDFDRFRILYHSLRLFFRDLNRLWIVTPDGEIDEIRSNINDEKITVIPESRLIPEFRVPILKQKIGGWYRQQLIKIAIADRIETDFYLTLDADVVFTKPVCFSDLIKDDRAPCYRSKYSVHPDWYNWAERVLGIRSQFRDHNVTPAIFNKEAMKRLHEYLSQQALKVKLSLKGKRNLLLSISNVASRVPFFSNFYSNWRIYLIIHIPWTEYVLYYTFLERMGIFGKYHFQAEKCIYSKHSVWFEDQLKTWNPEKAFKDEGTYFLVVQSNTKVDPKEVWKKVKPQMSEKNSNSSV